MSPFCFLIGRRCVFLYLCFLFLFIFTAGSETIAQWDFENGSGTDGISGLTPLPYDSSVVTLNDGVLLLDNQNRSDAEGSIWVIPDDPVLTGHADGGSGYTSLILEADVKPSAVSEQMQLIRKMDGELGYQLFIRKDGRISFRIRTDEGAFAATSKNAIAADGRWHHIEAVWDSSLWSYNIHLAVDGVVAWKSTKIKNLTDTTGPLTIGGLYRSAGNIGQRFSGQIDNVQISVDRPEVMQKPGRPLEDPAVMTGQHLTNQPGFLSMQFVYQEPVTPECHAGTLVQRPDGSVMAAWFGGTHEGHVDVRIWQSVFDGSRWSDPRDVVAQGTFKDGSPSSVFNPVLFQYPDSGPMLLFYLSGNFNPGNMMSSYDGGRTWSDWVVLPGDIRGASKNKPILLDDGTLICPDNGNKGLKFDRTRDFGKTWLESGLTPPGEIDAIQPALLVHQDGRLQALARSKTGSIVTTWSEDQGATWSALEKTSLPNNYSGIDAVTLSDGRFVVVYNHSGMKKNGGWGARTPLNIAVSDDGINWSAAVVLEDEEGEYSYPVIIQSSDGRLHVLYTWHRLRMKHVVLDPEAFELAPIVDGKWPSF
ncbi:exo-alpha-sialidase [Tichowtungia aerotolerans]|uniref:Laminin G domain-containing protein n=1 Tax=Tichowtungia aerotolerans TaxID=2697043 RepID=A0A6P1M4A4_9BACT|nr:exo-alpha-sialidase [Tichowtungia aerotolerans]QHI69430.1 hypothetical protein GT409_08170 [Tichowtungia aerotolerans]